MRLCPQLFKRRNVCVPSSDESMLECPIQDPDISSTVPVAGVSVGLLFCSLIKGTFHPRIKTKHFSLLPVVLYISIQIVLVQVPNFWRAQLQRSLIVELDGTRPLLLKASENTSENLFLFFFFFSFGLQAMSMSLSF